ncbi:MAG: Gfo/Idh/MocA family oxidoreductase [Clostridia bacterium]|nr:Gfo/Idh/MocA family oxidoreductase [Clostridia bacterium]
MAEKKQVVVIGYGGMGGWHTRRILENNVVTLRGIYDIDPARAELAESRGIRAYPTFEAVLEDPAAEILVLAVPNELHKPLAIRAMEAGKHVVSEKPVCLSSEELAEMIAASEKYGRIFTVHQNRRWDEDYLMMERLYRSGELGEVFEVESRVQGSRGIPGDWRGKKEHGGGMILDWGVHLIDQMVRIVGDKRIERVYCRCEHITNAEVDDGFHLDLYFEDDVTARIEVGTSNFISLPRFYMRGTNGSATIATHSADAHVVCCTGAEEGEVTPVVTAAGLTKTMAPRTKESIREYDIPKPDSDVHDFYRNLVKAVDGEEPQLITHRQLMRVMKIMEAAFESDRQKTPVAFCDEV